MIPISIVSVARKAIGLLLSQHAVVVLVAVAVDEIVQLSPVAVPSLNTVNVIVVEPVSAADTLA